MVIKSERIKEILTKKALKEFSHFMFGQTITTEGVYDDDFLRFVKQLQVID